MTVLRIVTVDSGDLVSRATVGSNDAVTYEGGDTAKAAVRTWRRRNKGSEADAVRALLRDGWSNGYLMVSREDKP